MEKGMIGAAWALEEFSEVMEVARERRNYESRSLFDPRYEDRSMEEINHRLKELADSIVETLPKAARRFHDEDNPRIADVLFSFRYAAEYPLKGEGESEKAKAEYWEITNKYMMGYYDLHRFFESRIVDEVGTYISPYYEEELRDLIRGNYFIKRDGIIYRGAEGAIEETKDAYASYLLQVQRRDFVRYIREGETIRELKKIYYGFIFSEGRRLLAEASWIAPYEREWMLRHYEKVEALCELERDFYKNEKHSFHLYERMVHALLTKEILRK